MDVSATPVIICFFVNQELQVDHPMTDLEEEVITYVCVKILFSERIEQHEGLDVPGCMAQNTETLLLMDYRIMTYLVLSVKPHEDLC